MNYINKVAIEELLNIVKDDTVQVAYFWFSDQTQPNIFIEDIDGVALAIGKMLATVNPFVIEGAITFGNGDVIEIAHRGSYKITHFEIAKLKNDELWHTKETEALSHRAGASEKVKLAQLYKATEDDQCEGMLVDRLVATVFNGFE